MQKISSEYEVQATKLSALCTKIEESAASFDDNLEDKKVKVDNFIHNTKVLKQFQDKHKAKSDKIKELQFKKANLAAEANSLEEKRSQLKQVIPKLETEQKAMAAAKNFKAASMKKNQIKEAQEQIDLIAKKVENCFVEEKKLEEEVGKIEKEQMKYVEQQN